MPGTHPCPFRLRPPAVLLLLCLLAAARAQQPAVLPGAVGGGARPAPSVLANQDRIVVPGDTLNIVVEEQPDLNKTYGVAGDGTISLDDFGRVNVAERSLDGVRMAIIEHLETRFFKKATVTVTISTFVEGSVYITGLSGRGSMEIPFKGDELLTVFEAITKAGGLGPRADGRNVKILRWKPGAGLQREIVTVDVKYIYDTLDFTRDEYLRPRDIVMIPDLTAGENAQEILFLGEVGSPGYQAWTPNMNMLRLIATHGYGANAQLDSARILRPNRAGEYTTIPTDISLLLSGDMSQNHPILPGDMIYIPRAGMSRAGVAYFYGEVGRQGPFELPLRGDLMLSQALLQVGATPFAKLNRVVVMRRDPSTNKKHRLEFNAQKIWDTGNIEDDLPLQDGDVVMVGQAIFTLPK